MSLCFIRIGVGHILHQWLKLWIDSGLLFFIDQHDEDIHLLVQAGALCQDAGMKVFFTLIYFSRTVKHFAIHE